MLSSERSFQTIPLVKLGNHFDKVNDFLKRFPGIPNLLELDHLTVSGDVVFGRNITLKVFLLYYIFLPIISNIFHHSEFIQKVCFKFYTFR